MICNSCDGTWFANAHQLPPSIEGPEAIAAWVAANAEHDVAAYAGNGGNAQSY